MKLKVGDKLSCKMSLKVFPFYQSWSNARIFAFKDDVVEIVKVNGMAVNGVYNAEIKNNKGETMIINSSREWDYFYTEKELRKLKLDKLDEKI